MELLLLIVFLILLFLLFRMPGKNAPAPHESPLNLMRKRLDRGEITKDDFERVKRDMLKNLSGNLRHF